MAVNYIHSYRAKGKVYSYYRRGGKRVRIKAAPNTIEFVKEVDAIEQGWITPETASRGALGYLIGRYKASDRWDDLKPATKLSYDRAFDALKPLHFTQLKELTRPAIITIRDEALFKKHGRWMANNCVAVLRILFLFGTDVDLMKDDRGNTIPNPFTEKVRRLRKPKGAPRANRRWKPEERSVVLAEADTHVRLVIATFMCTGMRKADVFTVTVPKTREIEIRTSKTDHPIKVPMHRVLIDALNARPKSDSNILCVNLRGEPLTPDGFDTLWHKLKTRLEAEGKIAPGLTLHGLRHTLGSMLKEAGLHDGTIADVLGQSSTSMARHYSREAGLPQHAKDTIIGLSFDGPKVSHLHEAS